MWGPRLRSWGAVATAAAPFLLAVLLAWAPTAVEPGEELSGGEATVFDDGPNAYGRVAPGTTRVDWMRRCQAALSTSLGRPRAFLGRRVLRLLPLQGRSGSPAG